MPKKVVMIKTVAGEYYIGYKKEFTDTATTDDLNTTLDRANNIWLEDARSLTMQATPRGAALACIPLVPFAIKSPDTMKIAKTNILHEIEEENINDQIVKGYKSEITGLDLPSTPKIVTA